MVINAAAVNTTPADMMATASLMVPLFSGVGYLGDEGVRQRSRVYLSLKLHIYLFCSINYVSPF